MTHGRKTPGNGVNAYESRDEGKLAAEGGCSGAASASSSYPLSITVWLLVVAGAIVLAPKWERTRAEVALRQMGFEIKQEDGKWSAYQTDRSFSRLAEAGPLFAKLPPILELDLSYCSALTSVEGLKELKGLLSLYLIGCRGLTSVETLKELKGLRWLNLDACSNLPDQSVAELRVSLPDTKITSDFPDIPSKPPQPK